MNPDLQTLISPWETNLLGLARRQFLIEAFTGDLDRITRGKLFRFRNDVVWLLLLDTRDMHVVHLTSWADGVLESGGLIGQLQAHHISGLARVLPPAADSTDGLPEWVHRSDRERREREHSAAFNRLFSNAGAHPNGADFDKLRQAFRSQMKPLKDDRNWNRAHPFEKVSGTTKMLNVPELRSQIDYAEQFMNDLSMVGCHRTMSYSEMNVPYAADVAPDLVDAMLIGDPDRVVKLRGKSSRDEMYARLHADYEARPPAGTSDFFNDIRLPVPPGLSVPGGS